MNNRPTCSPLMRRRRLLSGAALGLALAPAAGLAAVEEQALPPPRMSGGKPLMDALRARHTERSYAARPLSPQQLSDLLWAAFGINRRDAGGRTAPSAHDAQDIDIYVVLPDAAWHYDPLRHALQLQVRRDLRRLTGRQDFVVQAPVNLVFVSDFRRFPRDGEAARLFYSAADAGFISQNVYLYCASEGLATMVRAYIDQPALAKALALAPSQRVILAQSVGFPA